MRRSVKERVFAIICYFTCGSSSIQAAVKFEKEYGSTSDTRSTARFIERNVEKFQQHGTVHDLPASGAPRKVPTRVLRHCCKVFKAGFINKRGEQQWYRSINDAIKVPGYLKDVVDKYHIERPDETLLKRMLEYDPDIVKTNVPNKHVFKEPEKEARRRVALELLQKGIAYLLGVVWIDAKHGTIPGFGEPTTSGPVYTSKEALAAGKVRTRQTNTHQGTLWYYIAVNAIIGPVWMGFVQGTKTKGQKVLKSDITGVTHKVLCHTHLTSRLYFVLNIINPLSLLVLLRAAHKLSALPTQ